MKKIWKILKDPTVKNAACHLGMAVVVAVLAPHRVFIR
jgi:hypothetical protein